MHRALRYAVALLVGAAVTVGVALVTPPSEREPILLVAIAPVFVADTLLALRYPSTLWGAGGGGWPSAALAGVTTFGTMSLLQGVEGGQNVAVAVLGGGLVAFGFAIGVAFERERDDDPASE